MARIKTDISELDRRAVSKVTSDINSYEKTHNDVQQRELKDYNFAQWYGSRCKRISSSPDGVDSYLFSMKFGKPNYYKMKPYKQAMKGNEMMSEMVTVTPLGYGDGYIEIGQIPVQRFKSKDTIVHGLKGVLFRKVTYPDGSSVVMQTDKAYKSKINIGGYVIKNGVYEGPKRIPDNGKIHPADIYEGTELWKRGFMDTFKESFKRNLKPTIDRYYKRQIIESAKRYFEK